MIDAFECDVLVLGAGGAGLCAALHAADASPTLSIAVVVKGLFGRAGCTRMVQGGYNAVLTPPDSLEAHLTDTLDGGGWINDQELVWRLVTEAPGRVLELESRYGCLFDRNAEGRIHQKPFAGQTHDRTVHKGDLTGIEIMNRLTEQAQARPSIRAFEECRAVELLRDDAGRAAGALALDARAGRFFALRARATLLAMGGGPTMYRVIACSADKAADGIALAYRAGLPLRDMEMIQFHPTGLVIPGSLMTGALLEEGLRGAGGQLRNGLGERFMARYDAARMERSTRDLVSRASFLEVSQGRGTPNGGVWIDVSHLGAEVVERNFRGMVRRCRDFGRDLARGPVEVGPTAHFMMGGVVVDPDCRTAIEGLFAAGEDTGGVHGANRLGGNGVAESTVFGGIAGDVMAAFVAGRPMPRVSEAALEAAAARCAAPLGRGGGAEVYAIQRELRDVMWERAGLVRDAEGLGVAAATLERLTERLGVVGVPGHGPLNTAWQDWLNLDSQLTAARLIVASALARRESRGAHWRRDFPVPAATPPVCVRVQGRDGAPLVWAEPVAMTRARPPAGARRPVAVEIGD
ncbi:MAG: succinate dehydrogenase/fumarate reductase flavoprotein subunit [Candidatus Rokuibacteriota bacterium]|nr:MAG: succinate dehydrogenase/fumarate reductase flavoprotein subunit [Candidatus Rokubacteria bacterium]